MKIGRFQFDKPVCAAPMAGVTDKVFRVLAREFESDLVWTEMVSAKALTYQSAKTFRILDIAGEQKPVIVQLFGAEPEFVAEGAMIAEANGAEIIDLNMGCPAPKIVKNFEGAALLKNLPLAVKIVSNVVNRVKIPVTVKIRLGWDKDSIVAVELAKALEEVGAACLTVHGRTRDQYYSGKADWSTIAGVKQAVSIPVIGNGDIWEPQDAKTMLEQTGCDGVMIGRGALGNPWIFKRTAHLLRHDEILPSPTGPERVTIARKHLQLLVETKGALAVAEMRKHAAWYTKGLRDAARVRDLIMKTQTFEEMDQALMNYYTELNNR